MKPQAAMMGTLEAVEVGSYGDGKTLAKCVLRSGEDRIPFTAFGRLVGTAQECEGRRVVLEVELSGREYNSRLYLECVARNLYLTAQEQERQPKQAPASGYGYPKQPVQQPAQLATPKPTQYSQPAESELDDIPF